MAEGERRERATRTKERAKVPAEFTEAVDRALITMRNGDPKAALADLRRLETQQPDVSSMSYLVALAAMRSGDLELAEAEAVQSIAKDERVSDSLALQAIVLAMKRASPGFRSMGDTKLRADLLLRQAILADAANPVPYIRLAILLRYQNKNDEAGTMLRAAWARLNPSDGTLMVETTMALLELEKIPDAELPAPTPDLGKGPAALIAAAYTAMRKNDFARAAESLRLCQGMVNADAFGSILLDPVFRPYRTQPELAAFFPAQPTGQTR